MVVWYHQLDGHEFEQALGLVMDSLAYRMDAWLTVVHGVAVRHNAAAELNLCLS